MEGDSNDYIGKGLSGGKIIVVPNADSKFDPAQNVIIGNVAFYGAIKGEAYILGNAGETLLCKKQRYERRSRRRRDHGCESYDRR